MTDWHIPIKTDFMREQSLHEPSMQYAQDIHKMASQLSGGFVALEIGNGWAFSSLAILEAGAKHLTSVDPNVMSHAQSEVDANGYTDKFAWTVCRSDKYWQENKDVHFQLIYIDGSHRFDDVKNDLHEAFKRLDSGGLLMADDVTHKKNQSVDIDGKSVEYGVSLACWQFYSDHYDQIANIGIQGQVLWFSKK